MFVDVDIGHQTRWKKHGKRGRKKRNRRHHPRRDSHSRSKRAAEELRTRRGISSRYHPNNRKYGRIESKENIVEALVVLDKRVVGIHGRDYVEPYTLTIMNIVSKLYEDPTLGNRVKVVVVRIIVLLEDQVCF